LFDECQTCTKEQIIEKLEEYTSQQDVMIGDIKKEFEKRSRTDRINEEYYELFGNAIEIFEKRLKEGSVPGKKTSSKETRRIYKIIAIAITVVIVSIVLIKFHPYIKYIIPNSLPASPKSRDAIAIEEAEKFFNAVKSAGDGVYGETNLPRGFSKNSNVLYEGNLTVDKNGISGKMMFRCPPSENRFTLDQNGVISPKPGDEDTAAGITFVWVPGGCFQMGCEDENCPGEPTCIEGFWFGKHEVTQGQWKKIMGKNPSAFHGCGDGCPVERVSWNDVQDFIEKLGKEDFTLPTEAQWEYACRYGKGINFKMQEWCEDDYGTLENYKSFRSKDSQCTISKLIRKAKI
jgi:hypothetical protein